MDYHRLLNSFLSVHSVTLMHELHRCTGAEIERCASSIPLLLQASTLENVVTRWATTRDICQAFELPPAEVIAFSRELKRRFSQFTSETSARAHMRRLAA